MTLRARGLNPVVRRYVELALAEAQRQGFSPIVTSTFRSRAEQLPLYRKWLQAERRYGRALAIAIGFIPANPPGLSGHQFGLAWDSYVKPEFQKTWNRIREALGFHVPPNDQIHAEVPSWSQYVR